MGGRGAYSGIYRYLSESEIESRINRLDATIREKVRLAYLSGDSPTIMRKRNAARKALDKARDEQDELYKALEHAKRRKKVVPF